MTEIYFIPGLGADYRLYTKQKLAGFSFTVLEWIKPLKGESMQSYAARLSEKIHNKANFVLVGVSLGGIMAQEIARIHPPKKIIIISSAKSESEIPFYFRLFRYFPLHRLIPGKTFRAAGMMARRILGGTSKVEGQQVQAMIASADPDFMHWAIHQVIHWKFTPVLKNLVHLHGTSDIMFPAKMIKNAILIRGGSHIMVYTKSAEVNAYLQQEFETIR